MNFLINNLSSGLITPAIILAVLAYFIRLFGMIIVDLAPVSDDKKWRAEFAGLMFFINFIVYPGLVGVLLAYWSRGWLFFRSDLVNLILLLGVFVYFALKLTFSLPKHFGTPIELSVNKSIEGSFEEEFRKFLKGFIGWFQVPSGLIIMQVAVGILLFSAAHEYLKGNVVLLLFFLIFSFLSFICIAANYSIKTNKLIKNVDIYFLNNIEPMLNCTVAKINNDNIKLIKDRKLIFLNKNEVLRIVMNPNLPDSGSSDKA